jgi:peptide/nickel transport system substrate-binding protein
MKPTIFRSVAVASLLLVGSAMAATRPHYGGSLRVETRGSVYSLDAADLQPTSPDAADRDHIARLLYDTLVRLNDANSAQPALAKSWQADPDFRRWEFELRDNVKLSDGSALTPKLVAASLSAANPNWRIRLLGNSLIIESDAPTLTLPAELAMARNSIVVRNGNGVLLGSGAFRVREFQPGRKLTLDANDDYWGGRPFVNTIDFTMGRTLRDQSIDLQAGNADVVEVAPEQVRRAMQEGQRVSVSSPVELIALQFSQNTAVREARVRQAISQAVDRLSLQNALLQKQGEAAASLLPQWVSGYSFLFPPSDLAQARDAAAGLGYTPQLTLAYDNADALARTIAERVALNARDTGLRVQTVGEPRSASVAAADARIVHLALPSSDPRTALAAIAGAIHSPEASRVAIADAAEDLWAVENAIVQSYNFVPLLYLPQAYGLSPRVKDWVQPRLGWWPVENVWLEGERP